MPYGDHGIDTRRPAYRPGYPGHGPQQHHGWDHDRDHHRRHGSWGFGSYAYGYPGWAGYYPYPFVSPWLDDWSDTDESSADQPYSAEAAPGYDQGPPYADYGDSGDAQQYGSYAPAEPRMPAIPRQPYGELPGSASIAPEEPLTVVFNNGRAPQKIQNYMISSNALTDLDKDHYEQIPLDQIDVAATRNANRAHGVSFKVPASSGD